MDNIENTENSDIENITKVSQKKILMSKGGKEKTDKQIKQWENAQNMRLRKAQLKKERDDEIASIRNENNNLKKQMAVVSKKDKTNKVAIVKPDSEESSIASSESESKSETESDDSDSENEQIVAPPKKYRKRQIENAKKYANKHVKILKPNPKKSHRMQERVKDDTIDYHQYFI